MKQLCLLLGSLLLAFSTFCQDSSFTIAFGSCAHQTHSLPIFNTIVDHKPDLFVFLGDNIYGDTKDMAVLKSKYEQLRSKPSFQRLKDNVDIVATWDDHDYGWNDAGEEYPQKEASKKLFLDFFDEPVSSERREHSGIYTSYIYEVNAKRIQLILLDNRTFRDKVKPYSGEVNGDARYFYQLDYGIHESPEPTFLGEEQWQWLEKQFDVPADIRIIGSGSQFGIEFNGYESWANFPHEQLRLLNLIHSTKTNGVLFITGDVHYGEISVLRTNKIYPIYDITSSGLSSTWHFATPNRNRIEGPIMENHFGLLTINCNEEDPSICMEIWDVTNNRRVEYTVRLSDISFN